MPHAYFHRIPMGEKPQQTPTTYETISERRPISRVHSAPKAARIGAPTFGIGRKLEIARRRSARPPAGALQRLLSAWPSTIDGKPAAVPRARLHRVARGLGLGRTAAESLVAQVAAVAYGRAEAPEGWRVHVTSRGGWPRFVAVRCGGAP